MLPVSQIKLFARLWSYIEKRYKKKGVKLNMRHQSAVLGAINNILAELATPDRDATPGCGLRVWLASDRVGLSSRYMASVLAPLAGLGECPCRRSNSIEYPCDPSDLGRCITLLAAVPEMQPHVKALTAAHHGLHWNRLVEHWDELTALFAEESPMGKCPKLYERMTAILDEATSVMSCKPDD